MKAKWLVVGNAKYDDVSIDNVCEVKKSIEMLFSAISKAYNDDRIIQCKNDLNNEDFHGVIEDFYQNIEENVIPFFYFCGHGYSREKKLYLAASNSTSKAIESSSVCFSYIQDSIKRKKIKTAVIILDCCYSGAANGLSTSEDLDYCLSNTDYPNIVCLTSCKSVERAFILKEKECCAFTYYFSNLLIEGVDNRQHWVSLQEIYHHIRGKIDTQTPTILSTGNFFGNNRIIPNVKYRDKKFDDSTKNMKEDHILRVLLVKSSIDYPIKSDGDFGVPLGLWLLKSYIQRTTNNIIVDIFDERLRRLQKKKESFTDCARNYDVIGASMCSCEVPPSLEKLKIAKDLGKITIAGGIFTYSNEDYLLRYPFVDFVVPGVGTYPLAKLFDELRKRKEHRDLDSINKFINDPNFDCFGIQNVFSRGNLNDAVMWEAASMPHIELDVWETIIKEYHLFLNNKIDIFTARGCNKNCSFCSVQRETKHNVILCDNVHIIRTIDHLYKMGMRKFSIKDEDFFLHGNSRVENILSKFVDYEGISFKIRARIDTMLASHESLENLAKYHVCEVQYGVESPNNELRKHVQKNIKNSAQDVIDLFQSHYNNGIVVNASFILGLPSEDKAYYSSLVGFIKRIYHPGLTKIYLNFYTPHPVKSKIPDDVVVVTNDLRYYTHKIPVCYSRAPKPKNYVRRSMLQAYETIVGLTNSRSFNPAIPKDIADRYSSDSSLTNNEILFYDI